MFPGPETVDRTISLDRASPEKPHPPGERPRPSTQSPQALGPPEPGWAAWAALGLKRANPGPWAARHALPCVPDLPAAVPSLAQDLGWG